MPKSHPTIEEMRALHLRRMKQVTEALGDSVTFPFSPSSGAYGPCTAAAGYEGQSFLCDDAPLPPLPNCSHPDQCMCMFGPVDLDTVFPPDEERQESAIRRYLRGFITGWTGRGHDG